MLFEPHEPLPQCANEPNACCQRQWRQIKAARQRRIGNFAVRRRTVALLFAFHCWHFDTAASSINEGSHANESYLLNCSSTATRIKWVNYHTDSYWGNRKRTFPTVQRRNVRRRPIFEYYRPTQNF
jgi:hypothetical protein